MQSASEQEFVRIMSIQPGYVTNYTLRTHYENIKRQLNTLLETDPPLFGISEIKEKISETIKGLDQAIKGLDLIINNSASKYFNYDDNYDKAYRNNTRKNENKEHTVDPNNIMPNANNVLGGSRRMRQKSRRRRSSRKTRARERGRERVRR